jgi:hypothetical protein
MLAEQVLYRLSHTSSLFCSGYFGHGCVCAGGGGGSHKLFALAGLKPRSS